MELGRDVLGIARARLRVSGRPSKPETAVAVVGRVDSGFGYGGFGCGGFGHRGRVGEFGQVHEVAHDPGDALGLGWGQQLR